MIYGSPREKTSSQEGARGEVVTNGGITTEALRREQVVDATTKHLAAEIKFVGCRSRYA